MKKQQLSPGTYVRITKGDEVSSWMEYDHLELKSVSETDYESYEKLAAAQDDEDRAFHASQKARRSTSQADQVVAVISAFTTAAVPLAQAFAGAMKAAIDG